MPLFDYSGYNAGGRKVSGTIEGSGRRLALQQLKVQGIIATTLVRQSGSSGRGVGLSAILRQPRVPVGDLASATRQLATLLGAGIPLDEAVATVAGQQENIALLKAFGATREELLQGQALHQGLALHPRIFSNLYVNMVKVGESSGTLDQVMLRLADFLEEQARLKSRIQSALAYPVLMALVGSGVLFFLLTFVVPKVTRMLEDIGQELPLATRALIGMSDFLSSFWWLLMLAAGALFFGFYRYLQTERGQYRFDQRKLSLPLIGKLNLLLATARFTRTLATLLESGVPLLAGLEIVQNLMPNRVLKKVLDDTILAVREGESLAQPLQRARIFPKMVSQMAAVGEKSGDLEGMLLKVAETYEHQVDAKINALLSLLEPIMILLMGVIVGFIVLAILLPIFQASQGIG
jgi:general secretion pathway protein F